MKVFLTGATGFLGAAVVRSLLASGAECAVLARRPLAETRLETLAPRLARIAGDLRQSESYRAALAAFAPDVVVHAAWAGADGAHYDDPAQFENVTATARLVEAAIDSGAKAIVGVGSQTEYGPKSGAISERDAANPTTLYGIAKLAACRVLLAKCEAHGLRGAWGRVFSIYGAGDDDRRFLSMLIHAFRAGRSPDLTPCEQLWDFLHVDDAAAAIAALVKTPARGVYNIGSGDAVRLRDLVLELRDRLAPSVEIGFGRLPYRQDQVMRLQADISRLRAATGWSPKISLADGLDATLSEPAAARLAPEAAA
jgi:UDP-glucose 4-epimerase